MKADTPVTLPPVVMNPSQVVLVTRNYCAVYVLYEDGSVTPYMPTFFEDSPLKEFDRLYFKVKDTEAAPDGDAVCVLLPVDDARVDIHVDDKPIHLKAKKGEWMAAMRRAGDAKQNIVEVLEKATA